jgi:glycosyltransferase involved in cell wall biosynthesis
VTSGRASVRRPVGPPVQRSDSLRVLMVVDSLAGGGAERHVVELAVALRHRGHNVAVACSTSGVLAPALEVDGIAIHPVLDRLVKRRGSLTYARALRRLLGHWRPDVVHAHMYASAFAAAAATIGTGVPLVVTEHTEAPWRSLRARGLSWWTYRRASHIVTVSRAIERLLHNSYRVPADRTSFLLPAVPDLPPAPAGLPAEEGRPLIGSVGRLQPEKGVDVFLHATALVARACPAARFVVVGDGPLRARLIDVTQQLGLGERVEFSGYLGDARTLIGQLDVLVVSSHSDGSPLVVLEAMAAGVPVVATNVGGIPDQFRHRREGLLVQPGDVHGMAAAILDILADPNRARAMGVRGRERAHQLGHQSMVARVEMTYRTAIGCGFRPLACGHVSRQ